MNDEIPNRKNNRLFGYDYSEKGAYFITICAANREKLFGVVVGGGAFDAPFVKLSAAGQIIDKYVRSTNRIDGVIVEKYVIMPNHLHLLVSVNKDDGTSRAPSPTNALIPHLVSTLKRFANREIGRNVFQRSYHDHVVRNEEDFLSIWSYIDENPAKWSQDEFYI